MSLSSPELLAALRDLRQSIATEAARSIERWQSDIEQPSFVVSAGNLAHYLALRHHDLRDLQRELMRRGLSSLGRLESRVLLTLKYRGKRTGRIAGRRANGSRLATFGRRVLPWRDAVADQHASPAGWHARWRRPDPGHSPDRGGAGLRNLCWRSHGAAPMSSVSTARMTARTPGPR